MAIYYMAITNTIQPSPGLGAICIIPVVGATTYQPYIWLGKWVAMAGGGVVVDETDTDTHYINVIVQEARPDGICKSGNIWIKPSTMTAKLALLTPTGKPASDDDYILIAA
jgi:hypothetical protein